MRICCACPNSALEHASSILRKLGLQITDQPSEQCTHLLLPVPTNCHDLAQITDAMDTLPDGCVVTGGNLIDFVPERFTPVDLLDDPYYLYENAAITAKCAVNLVSKGGRILVLGFGRIGKMICRELSHAGAEIFVAARNENDLALAHALGMHSLHISDAASIASKMDIVFNTIPSLVLPNLHMKPSGIAIDLASNPGMQGDNVIIARGLPNKMMPEASGDLIARSFIRLSLGKEIRI